MDELNLSSVNAESAVNVEPQAENTSTETINETVQTNNAEAVEPQQAQKQSQEENAKYAQIRRDYESKLKAETERARQEARDEYIASQGYEWNGKQIKTEAEYNQALKEKEIYDTYQSQGLPEDVIQKLAKVDQIESRWQAEEKARQQKEQRDADMMDFIKEFPDVKADDIPVEVWQANEKGIPLSYAYAKHALMIAKKAEEIAKANAENAKRSTGSVNGDGVANDSDFISYDAYEKNKSNQSWVNKNFDKIMNSRAKW